MAACRSVLTSCEFDPCHCLLHDSSLFNSTRKTDCTVPHTYTRLTLPTSVPPQDVAEKCKTLGITALHIKLRAVGGTRTKTPGPGAQSALRALARSGMKVGRIEVRPIEGGGGEKSKVLKSSLWSLRET